MNHLRQDSLDGGSAHRRPLPTQDGTIRKNANNHPCLEWDSNPRSGCPCGPRPHAP